MPDAGDRDLIPGATSPVVQAAERLVSRIEALVNQVAELKADNAALRREVRAAVSLLERQEGWAHIRTADDYTGWTLLAALRPGPPYAAKGRVAEVQSLFAHVYREPDVTRHAPVVTVPFETRFEVVAEPDNHRWLQVRLPDDRSGWLQTGDMAFDPKPLTIPEMLEILSPRVLASATSVC